MIASGCYKQLEPVPNRKDPGNYNFESPIFNQVFPHKVHLTKIHRQYQLDLIQAVNEICDGMPSQDSIRLVKSLSRPLPRMYVPTYLFGTNVDVTFYNYDQLEKIPGAHTTYRAIDDGKSTP